MSDRLTSGQPILDAVLDGGFPRDAINFVIGLPGTGKTILTEQYVFHNATAERPGVYLSTVSEPLDKLVRYSDSLDFFQAQAIGRSVFYEDLGDVLVARGLAGVLERIDAVLKGRRPGIVAIDSFKALRPFAGGDEQQFRTFLYQLAGLLSAFPASFFWVGEYGREEIATAPEFAVADAIVLLGCELVGERERRTLRVLKLRGSGYLAGAHPYRLSSCGIEVCPRLADPGEQGRYRTSQRRVSSGVEALDAMLADGYRAGSSTLVAGPPGSGKTVLGLHFVFAGAGAGEPGVLATLQENPTQLAQTAQQFGWSLDDEGVEYLCRSPADLYVDEWAYELLEAIERGGARRALIDGLTELERASRDPIRLREVVYSLIQRCARQGVSLLMTAELPELFDSGRLSDFGVSHLADNVLLLEHRRADGGLRRTLTVLKTRASRHETRSREFEITRDGIVLGELA